MFVNNTINLENLYKTLKFISNKDYLSFLKYSQILTTDSIYNITLDEINQIGICICDEFYAGFRCQTHIQNNKPYECNLNSNIQACSSFGVCNREIFKLNNNFRYSLNKISDYKSYYCQCKQNTSFGLKCEYQQNKCNPQNSFSSIFIGSIQNNSKSICSNPNDFCYPITNNSFNCIDRKSQLIPITNFLIFNQTNYTDNLDLNKSSVLMTLQDFIINQALKKFLNNDYVKIPKGPLFIFMQPISTIFNSIIDKLNTLFYKNYSKELLNDQLNALITNRIRLLIKEQLNNSYDIDFILSKVEIFNGKKFTDLSSLTLRNLNNTNDLFNLNSSLEQLNNNVNNILNQSSDYLEFNAINGYYLNFTNISYSFLKIETLLGIYLDTDSKLTMRPTTGIFLRSNIDINDLIFLPGIFSTYSNDTTNLMSIFTPGVMSLPIETYTLDNLRDESTKYLNTFSSIMLPFKINKVLFPFDSFNDLLNNSNYTYVSKVILTPIDFNQDSNFNILKNDIISSNQSFENIIKNITYNNTLDLVSTQILLTNSKTFYSRIANNNYNPGGIQLYDEIVLNNNLTIVPFIVYDKNQFINIPKDIIQKAIGSYCLNYENELNELHERICDSHLKERNLEEKYKDFNSNSSFIDFIKDYYEGKMYDDQVIIIKKSDSIYITILVLAIILGIVY